MSKANARAFLKKLIMSKELVERCQIVGEEERLRMAAVLGLPHTAQEMQAVIDEGVTRARHRLGELSDDELGHVSGGQGVAEVMVVPGVVVQALYSNVTFEGPLKLDLNH
jgi:hypothetical protein